MDLTHIPGILLAVVLNIVVWGFIGYKTGRATERDEARRALERAWRTIQDMRPVVQAACGLQRAISQWRENPITASAINKAHETLADVTRAFMAHEANDA
jgi:hypothetical protein